MTISDFDEITTDKPEKSLLAPVKRHGGRNNTRPHHDAPPGRRPQAPLPHHRLQAAQGRRAGDGRVDRVRPEPLGAHRAAALRRRRQGLHPRAGPARGRDRRCSPVPDADIKPGNACRSRAIPIGHDRARRRAAARGRARAWCARPARAPSWCAQGGRRALLRLPSGELRRVPETCRATIGQVGNATHQNQSSGKAGRSRWLGKRPCVRGTAMNPVDHPHGGGEGKNKGSHPVTPWGKPTLGRRTRNPKKASSTRTSSRGRKRGKGRK